MDDEKDQFYGKMFSLKKFWVSGWDFKLVCFCKDCKESEICFT